MDSIKIFFEVFFLVLAVSLDAFAASFSYGTEGICIPKRSGVIIGAVCSGTLIIGAAFRSVLMCVISDSISDVICFLVLFLTGAVKLFDVIIKAWIQRHGAGSIQFHIMDINFLLSVYCDSTRADADGSRTLCSKEAVALALALSADGIATGFGAGAYGIGFVYMAFLAFILNFLLVLTGSRFGRCACEKLPVKLSWISGVTLMVMAVLKLR